MSDRTARLEQYRAQRIAAMAGQPPQPGAIDPQMQLIVDAMSQAFAQLPAFQQPAAAAAAAPQIIQTHTAENCPEIAKRKANGTWQDRPRKQAGRRS